MTTEVALSREQQIQVLRETAEDLAISITEEAQKQLQTLQDTFPPDLIPEDLSDKENFKFVHQTIQKIKKPRIGLEKSRKELVTPFNEVVKKINGAAKPLKEAYLELEAPWKQAKKDFEIAEEIRKRKEAEAEQKRSRSGAEAIAGKIAWIKSLPGLMVDKSSSDVAAAMREAGDVMNLFDFQEFSNSAQEAYNNVIPALERIRCDKVRLEEFEKQEAERKAKEEEERKAREEAERKRLEEERKRNEEREAELRRQQEEIRRQQEELRRQQEEIARQKREEQERKLADERKAKEEAERKAMEEAEKKRLEAGKINAQERKEEAALALHETCRINPALALSIVEAIQDGKIPHITFEG